VRLALARCILAAGGAVALVGVGLCVVALAVHADAMGAP
jgi:hypothetical protein